MSVICQRDVLDTALCDNVCQWDVLDTALCDNVCQRDVLDTALCDNVCQWFAVGYCFSPGTSLSSAHENDSCIMVAVGEYIFDTFRTAYVLFTLFVFVCV